MNEKFFNNFRNKCPCQFKEGIGEKRKGWCYAKSDVEVSISCEFESCPMIFFFNLLEKWKGGGE